mmetsp:Transcript_12514/g.28084  ORF Transcript_12514/g.28084 Transcript_12514/m.28084 type:complete len:115 (+) Transcript_12514:976-1320(+)
MTLSLFLFMKLKLDPLLDAKDGPEAGTGAAGAKASKLASKLPLALVAPTAGVLDGTDVKSRRSATGGSACGCARGGAALRTAAVLVVAGATEATLGTGAVVATAAAGLAPSSSP